MSAARKITYSFPHLYAASPETLRRVRERTKLRVYDPGPIRPYRSTDLPRYRPRQALIANVQAKATGTQNFNALTSANGSWTSTTTLGNYLIAVLGFSGGGLPGTITAPSPWTQRGTNHAGPGNGANVAFFECLNASAQTTAAQSWSWPNPIDACVIIYAEYSGVGTASVADGTDAYNSGTSLTVTGGALATTNANNLLIGAMCNATGSSSNAVTFTQSGPWVIRATNSQRDTLNIWAMGVVLLEQIVAATNTYTATVTSNRNISFVAGTLASKAPGATFPGDDGSEDANFTMHRTNW